MLALAMHYAVGYGDRLLMMHSGEIVLDAGSAKANSA